MLKSFVLKNPYQLFITILLPFLLSTVLLLFVQSSFLNQNFVNFSLNMVYNQQKTDLQNTSRNVSLMADSYFIWCKTYILLSYSLKWINYLKLFDS